MDDIYDRRCKKIWTHLVETPHDSYVDLEDIDNRDIEMRIKINDAQIQKRAQENLNRSLYNA